MAKSAIRAFVAGAFLFHAAEGVAFCQPDVRDVLERVAAAVRARYLGGYIVQIERHQSAKPHYGTPPGGTARDSGLPILPAPGRSGGAHDVITLARLGKNLRYYLKNVLNEPWQWITDGQTVWCYRRDLNLYTKTPAEPWPEVLGPGSGLPGVEWKYVTKFLAIGKTADRPDWSPMSFRRIRSAMVHLSHSS